MREKSTKLLLSCAALLFICMLACVVCVASARTIYVPDDYAKIQWAVDNASAGDIIIVRPGTYIENVDVDKSLEIRSYSQNPADTIVKASNPNDHVFHVTANNVNIIGFTVTGATSKAGVYLNSNDNIIANNNIYNNWFGIWIVDWGTNNNTILNNTIYGNNNTGIFIGYHYDGHTSNNIISNNSIVENGNDGIFIGNSLNSVISSNIIGNNSRFGIWLHFSSTNTISDNIITGHNGSGDWYSAGKGVFLADYSQSNVMYRNMVENNYYGIYCGYIANSNIIYLNNFVNNNINAAFHDSTNIWNSTEQITYTYNGIQYTNYLGNYWSDYTGNDSDGDGIGDTPYSIDRDKDNYPLMERFEYYIVTPVPNQQPIANFTYYPEKPVVNQSVTFDASSSYDPDGKITSYEWDFGDGNITSTTEEKIKHSYSEAGSYKVTLTVTDDEGATNSSTKIITVMPAKPSVFISTDKYEYRAGDVMLINITIKNPRNEWKNVKFLWLLDIPDYDKHFIIINNRSLLLPALYDRTFTLRWKLPELKCSFNASWHVAIFNATTSELISEDYAEWKYLAEKAKKSEDVEELEKSVREIMPF